jgi:hypothetical protein
VSLVPGVEGGGVLRLEEDAADASDSLHEAPRSGK